MTLSEKILDALSDGEWHDPTSDEFLDACGAGSGLRVAFACGVLIAEGRIRRHDNADGTILIRSWMARA